MDGVAGYYEMLMLVNRELFQHDRHDAACHALAAALHCAGALGDPRRLDAVQRRALAQQGHIDAHLPGARLASARARERGARTLYESVARRAGALTAARAQGAERGDPAGRGAARPR